MSVSSVYCRTFSRSVADVNPADSDSGEALAVTATFPVPSIKIHPTK